MAVAGCGAISGQFPRTHSIIPDTSVRLLPSYAVTLEDAILTAGVLYLVYQVVDPTAPAWEIKETRMAEDSVAFTMQMQAVHVGGQGEARQVLLRRAHALMAELGYTELELRRFEESIESRIFLPRRTAHAEVRFLTRK